MMQTRRRSAAARWRLAAAFTASALAAGCLGVGLPSMARSRGAADMGRATRPDDYPIFLTDGDVIEPYEILGSVQSTHRRENEIDALGPAELKQKARQMGGDAVILIWKEPRTTEEIGYRPGALTRVGTRFATHFVVGGTVIRFTREGLYSAPSAPIWAAPDPMPEPAPAESSSSAPAQPEVPSSQPSQE